jgi:hypothetical protein
VKALKEAAGYITTAWQNQVLQSVGPGQNSGTAADARTASESDRPPREGKSENALLADLERRVKEIRPSILRAIEKRFGCHLLNNPETRQRTTEHPVTGRSATAAEKPPTPPPRKQEEEWKVVASKRVRRKETRERGKKRGKDCGPNTTGEATANAATPGKDDGISQTEQRRSCNENRTDAGIEDSHAPPHTANICGDPHTQRGSKNKHDIR